MKRISLILAGLAAGVLLFGFVSSSDPYFQIKKNFTTFSEVVSEISDLYVVDVEPERMMRRGINAMLETLDPYTVVIDEADTQEIDIMTTGSYAGVGIEVGARGGRLVVIAPVEGYSAHRKGVRAGDVILSVNGISSDELNTEDLQSQLRGEPGSTVELVVERFGIDEPIEFELTRERIEIRNVSFYGFADEDNKIGYIVLRRFSQQAAQEVRESIESLSGESELEGLILDVRNNPGGLLTEAVRIVDLFLPAGEDVVTTRGRHRDTTQRFRTETDAVYADLPLVVLQNEGSASSSEIVAGALQDHDRAVIIGERSFGKGLVQIIRPLSYSMALKITTSKYYLPSGRLIQSVDYNAHDLDELEPNVFETKNGREVLEVTGVTPDISKESRPESMLEIALLRGNHYFFFANEYVSEFEDEDLTVNHDRMYSAFLSYLDDAEFTFQTRAERMLGELESRLVAEYGESGPDTRHLDNLREEIEAAKKKEFDRHEGSIRRELYLELISRFDGPSGRQQADIKLDPVILEALEIASDSDRFWSILSGEDE